MMGVSLFGYLIAQARHTLPKAKKDSTFRVAPAIETIQRHVKLLGPGTKVVDVGPRNLVEVRLLIRLWKDGQTPGPRVLLPLTERLHVRNAVTSGLVGMMRDAGHRVTALVPRDLVAWTTRREPGVAVEAVEPYLGARWRRWLRRAPLRTLCYASREATEAIYRQKLGRRRALRHRLGGALARALDRVYGGERLARGVESLIPPSRRAERLVATEQPDVVLLPTTIYAGAETEIQKAAQRAGVPVLVAPASFDTLASKGSILVRPDALLVWGEASRRHAVDLHGFPGEAVHVTGPAHWDFYAETSNTGPIILDPMVLVAGTTVAYWRDELAMVEALGAALAGTALVWYRPHPRRRERDIEAAFRFRNVRIDEGWRAGGGDGDFSVEPFTLTSTRGLLDKASCVVAALSTLTVEAALMGKPTFLVGFGDSTQGGAVRDHAAFTHLRDVFAIPGVVLCHSLEALIERVRSAATEPMPESDREVLRAGAREIAYTHGQARARIVEVVEEYATSKSSLRSAAAAAD